MAVCHLLHLCIFKSHCPYILRITSTTGRTIRILFYCVKKTLLVNYSQFKVPASSHFFEIYWSSKYRTINQNGRWNLRKIAHFHRPVQKEINCLKFTFTQFVIYTLTIFPSYSHFEANVFCLFPSRLKNRAISI